MSDLQGQHVRLYPYQREGFPRDVLYACWKAMEDDGAALKLFYAQPAASDAQRGDLTEFVAYMTDPKRLVYLAQSLKTDELAGMVWFDDIQPGHRAAANVFFRRRFWGPAAAEGSRLALGQAFVTLNLASIWAYTPWPNAVRHAQRAGMRPITVLPAFVLVGGTPRDIHILRVTREEFANG